jgi:adenylate cyclase
MTEQRRLAAIVSADVAGYSRLMGRAEIGTLAALKAIRQEDPAIASHGGRIVKTTGDGQLLEFPSVVNAVRCAVEVQTAMADRATAIDEDRRMAFRIGINLGDIIVKGDDIFGDGVNIAAQTSTLLPAVVRGPVDGAGAVSQLLYVSPHFNGWGGLPNLNGWLGARASQSVFCSVLLLGKSAIALDFAGVG